MIVSSLGVNQPFFPRNQLAVWHGPAGMSKKDIRPITRVKRPCIPRLVLAYLDSGGWSWKRRVNLLFERKEATNLNQEQPSPASLSFNAAHVQYTVCEKSTDNIGNAHCGPEKAETDRHFVMLIKV
mgnify:FL=1